MEERSLKEIHFDGIIEDAVDQIEQWELVNSEWAEDEPGKEALERMLAAMREFYYIIR